MSKSKLSDVKLGYLNKYLKGQSVLDLGAGHCYYSSWLAERAPYLKITAVDHRDINEPLAKNIEYFNMNLEEALPFKDDSFDLIIVFDIIEHIENENQLFAELKRVCKSDGLIVGSVPHDDDKFLPAYNLTFYHRTDITHKRYHTRESVESRLRNLSLKIETVELHGGVNLQVVAEFFPRGMRFLMKKVMGLFRRIGLVDSQILKSDLFFVARKGE